MCTFAAPSCLHCRDRIGGRVQSYAGGGFQAPVDLGASLITVRPPELKIIDDYESMMLMYHSKNDIFIKRE